VRLALKHAASINPDVLGESTAPDTEIEYIDIGNVLRTGEIVGTQRMTFGVSPSRARRSVRHGDTIISTVRTYLEAIAFMQDPPQSTVVSTGFAVLRPQPNVDGRFLYFAVRAKPFIAAVAAHSTGVSYPAITPSDLGGLHIDLPPLPEQRAITAFLDRETAHIDELVAMKRALIDRLNERRHAAIYRWVSGGHMSATHKETRLPWLSLVPDHWEVAPLYSRYSVQLGKMLDAARISGNHLAPYFRNVNVQWDRLDLNDLLEMDFGAEDRVKYALRTGDLLVCEGGEVGRAAVWPGEPAGCYYQKALHRLRPSRPGEQSRFLLYVLWAAASMGVFVAEGNPNTFDHLTAEKLRCHRFPFPPFNEQRAIVTELDTRLQTISRLEDTTKRQIYVLLERRQALITAAVTGKIGVA